MTPKKGCAGGGVPPNLSSRKQGLRSRCSPHGRETNRSGGYFRAKGGGEIGNTEKRPPGTPHPRDMVAEAKFCLSQHSKEKVCCWQKSLGEERFPTKLAVVHPCSEGKSPNLKTDGTFAEGVRSVGEGREGKGSKEGGGTAAGKATGHPGAPGRGPGMGPPVCLTASSHKSSPPNQTLETSEPETSEEISVIFWGEEGEVFGKTTHGTKKIAQRQNYRCRHVGENKANMRKGKKNTTGPTICP